jgi:hypothetical protein
MPIIRRAVSPKAPPRVWPEPSAASIFTLFIFCKNGEAFANWVGKVLQHRSWQPGDTVAVKTLARELRIPAPRCFHFLEDLERIGAGKFFNMRPHEDDRVPYDHFTWHVDFTNMVHRALSHAEADTNDVPRRAGSSCRSGIAE